MATARVRERSAGPSVDDDRTGARAGRFAAVWLWIRRDARRRVRSFMVLALLVAAASTVVLATAAGGRRNGSAVDRLAAATRPYDLNVLLNEPGMDWAPVRALPEVAVLAEYPVTFYGVEGLYAPGEEFGFPPASPEGGVDMEVPVVLEGRRLDPTRVDEATISPALRDRGVRVGDRLTVRMLAGSTLEAVLAGAPAPDEPDGPFQDVVVVGVVKGSFFSDGVQTSHAFYERYRADLTPPSLYVNAMVRLRDGPANIPQFQADLERIVGHPVELADARDEIRKATNATSLERTALYAFAAAAAVASLVLVGQALLRTIAAAGVELPQLRALGFTAREQIVAVGAAPLVATLAGAVASVPLAWLASDRFPISVGRQAEPDPGRRFDLVVVGPGVLVVVVLAVAGCAVLAQRQVRGSLARSSPVRSSKVARALSATGAPLPLALGARLALERGRGATAVPVRPALIGAVVGILGVVGTLTFRDGLDRAVGDRGLFGQHFDAAAVRVGDEVLPPDAVAALLADSDVDAVQELRNGVVVIDGVNVSTFGVRDLRGSDRTQAREGRVPSAPDELSLAPTDRKALGVEVGDVVAVGPEGVPMQVVGEVFTPELSHTTYDVGARMTDEGLRRFLPRDDQLKFHVWSVRFRPGVDADAARERLVEETGQELDPGIPVADQEYLHGVRHVPLALGAFLALLAVAAVGHALATAVRRRRHDVAVLRVLGLTRRQARATVAWQATTLAVVGFAFGIPLGIVAGRTVWRTVADATPLLYVTPAALLAALLAGPAAIALANALAAWPGRLAARTRPAEVLRTE
jgi:cell division protein FtsX